MVDYQLAQLIKEPTRVKQPLIDVFIMNKEDNISHSGVYTLSISDHNLIYAVRRTGLPRGQPKFIQSRNFKHFNEENFLTDLKNASWPVIKSGMEMNSAWNAEKDIFLNIVDKHAPRRVMRVRNKPAPWLNSQLKEEMYERDWLKKKASETQRPDVWKAYKTKKLTVNKKVKKTKKDYYKHQIEGASGNLKATWKILNDLMGKKSDSTQINDLKTENSGPLSDPEKIAEYLNIHFTNVGPKLASEIPTMDCDVNPADSQQRVNSSFELKEVTISDVFKKLQEVNVAKATGHDSIPNKILKIAALVISISLADLFNLSITTNTFPDDWKVTKVFPLFKSDERNDPNNFRPISVLLAIARVFERLVYEQIYAYFTENNLIQPLTVWV